MVRATRLAWASSLVGLCTSEPLQACDKRPSWTIQHFNSTSYDYVGSNGMASFSFTYDLNNQTELITCPLHANYRCSIFGTQSDNSTVIDIQLGLVFVYTSVTQVFDCGTNGPTTFIGNADIELTCETVPFGDHKCTASSATLQGLVED